MNANSLSGLLTRQSALGIAVVLSLIIITSLIPTHVLTLNDTTIDSLFVSLGLLMAQGSPSNGKAISQRIMQMTVLLFALFITNIVLGSLTYVISTKVQSIQIDSFKAMVEYDYAVLYRRKSVFSEELDSPGTNRYMSMVKKRPRLLPNEKTSKLMANSISFFGTTVNAIKLDYVPFIIKAVIHQKVHPTQS